VIGVEFATVFNRLGREVVILEMLDAIVPCVDAEIGKLLRRSLEKKGVAIHTGARVTSIRSEEQATCTFQTSDGEKQVSGDVVIVAAGRRPNTESLGLEAVGIVLERGFIRVDDHCETSVSGIYAIGDVIGGPQLAHVASAQGLIAAANAAGGHERFRSDVVPACIYTSPEIAGVGMTEAEAEKLGRPLRIGRFPVSGNGRSLLMDESEGLVKIITDEKTGEILGAHIMAPRATELIGELCVAMKLEATVEELGDTIHPHPTVSEMILEAAHDVEGMSVHKPSRNRP
jgi:dihydrolipoamide dehydrogenase